MVNAQDVMALAGVQAPQTAELLKMPANGQNNAPSGEFASVLKKTTQFSISDQTSSAENGIASMMPENGKVAEVKTKDVNPKDQSKDTKADDRNENGKVKADNSKEKATIDKTNESKDPVSEKMEKAGEKLVKEVSEEMGVDEEEVGGGAH